MQQVKIESMKIIKPLTSLRFFAILAIFLYHMDPSRFSKGYIGVTFFFLLSGFLLSYRYFDGFQKPKLFSPGKFFAKRISRIYPLHVITLLTSIPLSFDNSALGITAARFLSNLFLVQSFIPKWDYFFTYNWVSWFLSDFMFCILMFPLFMFAFAKLRVSGKAKSLSVMLLIWLSAIFMISLGFQKDNVYWFYYISPYMRLVDFILGMLLGVVFLGKVRDKKNLNTMRCTYREIASIGFLMLLIYLSPGTPTAFSWSLFFAPGLVFVIYTFAKSEGIFSRILENNILIKLGELSFAFFLIHQLVIRYLLLIFSNLNPTIFASFAFILSLGLSYFYQKYLEEFFTKFFFLLYSHILYCCNNVLSNK